MKKGGKRNETTKCSYHRKSFVATYIARTMRPSGQVEKRKAATATATATGLYYMAELKLDWTELELYVTLHWAIGSSFFSLSPVEDRRRLWKI